MEQTEAREARSRAAKIREGIHSYLATLTLIAEAWQCEDWRTLGYDSWQSYVDEEFGEERLRLPREHRRKAVEELRLAGMPTRAIAGAIKEPQSTVSDDVRQLTESGQLEQPERIKSLDGKGRPATQPRRPLAPKPAASKQDQDPVPNETSAAPFPASGCGGTQDSPDAGATPNPADVPGLPGKEVGSGTEGWPHPTSSPETTAASIPGLPASDAELDASLDAAMADTDTRFRRNFSAAIARADDVWQFDVDRIAELYSRDYERELQPWLEQMTAWCEQVSSAIRRGRSGLRLVEGGLR